MLLNLTVFILILFCKSVNLCFIRGHKGESFIICQLSLFEYCLVAELSNYVTLMFRLHVVVAGKALHAKHVVLCSEMPEWQNNSKDLKFHTIQSNHTPFNANGRHFWLKALGRDD